MSKLQVKIGRCIQMDKERCRITIDIIGSATCSATTRGDCLLLTYKALRQKYKAWDKAREEKNLKQRAKRKKVRRNK